MVAFMVCIGMLKAYFSMIKDFFDCKAEELSDYYDNLPDGIRLFSDKTEWIEKLTEIKNNTSGRDSFKKRFFGWFNMFRIVKYLNFVHSEMFDKQPVVVSATVLLNSIGVDLKSEDTVELLRYFRKLERSV